jgi:hypothetical protein
MNERIRELRGQVKLDTNSLNEQSEINDMVDFLLKDPGNKILNAYMDKFAELIVRECADIMDGRDENGNAKDGQYLLTQFGIDASQRYT